MEQNDLLDERRYLARVTDAVMSRTNNGDPQVALGFEIVLPETAAGRLITWYGSLSDTVISKGKNEGRRVAETTLDALDNCGWDGEGFESASLQSCVGNEASIVVAHEEDRQGIMRAKVKFVNAPNSGAAAVKERMDDGAASNITKQFRGLLTKRKQQNSARRAATTNGRRQPPANAGDAWEDGPDADAYDDMPL